MQSWLQEGIQKLEQHSNHEEDVPDRQQLEALSNTAQKLLQLKEAGNRYTTSSPMMLAAYAAARQERVGWAGHELSCRVHIFNTPCKERYRHLYHKDSGLFASTWLPQKCLQ